MMMYLISALILMTSSIVTGQRPSYAGSSPIGFPLTPNRTTTTPDPLGDRFGETGSAALPIEANGDRDLIDRLSKLPIDKQPFWFINWQALDKHRKEPQTFQQRPSSFQEANQFLSVNLGAATTETNVIANRFASTTVPPSSQSFNTNANLNNGGIVYPTSNVNPISHIQPAINVYDNPNVFPSSSSSLSTYPNSNSNSDTFPDRFSNWDVLPAGFSNSNANPNGNVNANNYPAGNVNANVYPNGNVNANNYPAGNVNANAYPAGNVNANNYPAGNVNANNYPAGSNNANNYPAGNVNANNYPAGNVNANAYPTGNVNFNTYPAGTIYPNNNSAGNLYTNNYPAGNNKLAGNLNSNEYQASSFNTNSNTGTNKPGTSFETTQKYQWTPTHQTTKVVPTNFNNPRKDTYPRRTEYNPYYKY